MVVRRSLPAWVLVGGGYGVVDLGDAEAVVVEPALHDGAGTRVLGTCSQLLRIKNKATQRC
jgi:hypothetical protein